MLVQDDHMPVHSGGVSEGEQVGAHLAGVTNQRGSSLSCYILCLEGRIGPTGPPEQVCAHLAGVTTSARMPLTLPLALENSWAAPCRLPICGDEAGCKAGDTGSFR